MSGVVADIPSVVCNAREIIKSRDLENRCKTIECDFFISIPTGSDAYLMSNILHDWSDAQCITILKNCHKAMKKRSKLLIVEMVIPPGNQPSIAKLLDLEMLVTTGGRERTENEFKELLDKSGFRFSKNIQTSAGVNIIESVRL
jgi:hypothetical protein